MLKKFFIMVFFVTMGFHFVTVLAATKGIYYVMYIEGTIKVKPSGEVLKVGSQLNAEDEILFETPKSFADVFSVSQGRQVLRKPEIKPESQHDPEWKVFVKNILNPAHKFLGSRAGEINNKLDFQNHMGKGTYLVLGNTTRLEINPLAFPMSDTAFFFVRYDYHGETINKKLDFDGNTLILSKRTLFQIDNKLVNPKPAHDFYLYYYDARSENAHPITPFSPLFAEDELLKKELGVMVKILKSARKSENDIIKEAKAFLNQRYGTFSDDNFSNWFCNNFQISCR